MMNRDDYPLGVLSSAEPRKLDRPPPDRIIAPKPGLTKPVIMPLQLPASYNARDVYAKKCPSFNMITNQGTCSNCWAVSSTYMINDRVCMYSKDGTTQKFYSAKHMTSCVKDGCKGAYVDKALDYWFESGITTGGDPAANQTLGCKPYFADFYVNATDGYCNFTCDDKSTVKIKDRSFAGAPSYQIPNNHTAIMTEIYLYGPVVASFTIYEDFYYYYRNGIYKRVSDKFVGRHAAKLFGWGVENGVPFWYAANSWGPKWAGEGGFFRIQRGTNEARIEDEVYAAMPADGISGDDTCKDELNYCSEHLYKCGKEDWTKSSCKRTCGIC